MLGPSFGSVIIVNSGSVGLPFSCNSAAEANKGILNASPRAEYAILEFDDDDIGKVGIELVRISVDLQRIIGSIEDSGMSHSDWLIEQWEGKRSLFQ